VTAGTPSEDAAFRAALVVLRLDPRRRRLADDLETFVAAVPWRDDQPDVHRQDIMARHGFDRSRVAFLGKYVRHDIPEIGLSLVSGPRGYRFTLDQERIGRYTRHRAGHMRTEAISVKRVNERWIRHIEPSVPAGPAGRELRKAIAVMRRTFDRIVEDLEVLV